MPAPGTASRQDKTETERQAWYYHWVLTDSDHAKEIRLFNLGVTLSQTVPGSPKRSPERTTGPGPVSHRADVLAQVIAIIALFGSYAFIAYSGLTGAITIGDLVMYFLAFQLGLGFIQAILGALAGLYEDNLFLTNFYQFLDLKPAILSPNHPVPVPEPRDQRVEFRECSFLVSRRNKGCHCRNKSRHKSR